uniref:Ig-like domain-containing protein n=1 Tax=Eptatretus burgeri TaxID=7764 RepID=A0A8C4N9R1_EPTBU
MSQSKFSGGEVKKTRIVWNNQEGFTLLIQSQDHPGLCYCQTVINGTVYMSKQYIPMITDKAPQNALQLNISDQIYSLVGHSFSLHCSVEDLNKVQRVLSWIYPGSKLHGKEVTKGNETHHQSTLEVTNTTLDYTGQYVCILTYMFVEDGEMKYIKHQAKTSVNVLEKPLILLRSNTTRTIEVLKDQLSVKIKVEMEAYPAPETQWLKDNGVILSKQIRYLQQSQGKTFTLTIHELKREDAGLYVFWARACGNGITVTQNISFYLQVYEPPQVEGGLTVKDITYPLRSKQTLLCSAFGVPMPDIFWQWKPGSCENETGNHFPQSDGWWAQKNSGNVNGAVPNVWLSFQGSENKTLSTMEIYNAQFSGCYRCVSHNYLGNDSFGFAFYVTDVPSGLNIHLRDSGPMRVVEGDPLNLECAANKHLFSTPRWFLREEVLHTNFTETSREGDYSLISQLDFAMAQQVHGGVYECEARSCLTGILHRTNFTLIVQCEFYSPIITPYHGSFFVCSCQFYLTVVDIQCALLLLLLLSPSPRFPLSKMSILCQCDTACILVDEEH